MKLNKKRFYQNGAVVKPSTSMGARGVYFINDDILKKKIFLMKSFHLVKMEKYLLKNFIKMLMNYLLML